MMEQNQKRREELSKANVERVERVLEMEREKRESSEAKLMEMSRDTERIFTRMSDDVLKRTINIEDKILILQRQVDDYQNSTDSARISLSKESKYNRNVEMQIIQKEFSHKLGDAIQQMGEVNQFFN